MNLIERVFAENRHAETASLIGNGLTEVWKHSGQLGEFSQKVLSSVSPRVVVDLLKAYEIRMILVYAVRVGLGFMESSFAAFPYVHTHHPDLLRIKREGQGNETYYRQYSFHFNSSQGSEA